MNKPEIRLPEYRWRDKHGHKHFTGFGKAINTLAVIAVGFALFSEKGIDILGDKEHRVPENTTLAQNQKKYNKTFVAASPAGKFVLQYLRSTKVATPAYEGGWGINKIFTTREKKNIISTYNNGCLEKTAYDIAGGSIEGSVSGIFSSGSVSGTVPTAAAYAQKNANNPDQIVIKSGNSKSVDLTLNGVTNLELVAANETTQNILDTYGCKTGLQSWEGPTKGHSSDYVK